jgi:hypothetical protein
MRVSNTSRKKCMFPTLLESSSVADPGCLSQIPDPGFYPSRILDLGSRIQKQQQKRGILCSHKFHKIENYFSFEVLKKKIWANFKRFIEVFTQKIVNKLSKIWVWDPGSEIRDPEKTYSGSRIQGSKKDRIPDPDPQHWKAVQVSNALRLLASFQQF